MPKFIYTVLIFTGILWLGILEFAKNIPPDSTLIIVLFLLLVFIALTLSISVPVYFFEYKKAPKLMELRKIYRKAIKISLFISLGITILGGFRAFEIFTLLNVLLFLALYAVTYIEIFKK